MSLVFAEASGHSPSREFQVLRHDSNQVEICISNFGKFGQDETGNNSGCWWPIGTDHSYIYGAGIWFGTMDSLTGDTLVTTGYGTYGGGTEFGPGLAGWPVNHFAAVIYIYPDNWPAPHATLPMAPQVPVSHEDSWCCFNDCDSAYHIPGDTRPIGIEIYQTAYVWDNWCCDDIVFFIYDVKNVSGHTLRDCYVAVCTDCDIASALANDDRCSGIVEREYNFYGDTILVDDVAYQWKETEVQGTPPWFPGVIAFDLLQTPFDLVEGMDKDGDGIPDQYERDSVYYVNNVPPLQWDADNDGVPDWRDPSQWPQFGMTALKRLTLGFNPDIDAERYVVMAGYNFLTGAYEPYDTVPPDPDDQRFLMSSGPFDLDSDSIATLVFAVMFADWHEFFLRPDTGLVLVDKWAQRFYDQYWFLYIGVQENSEFQIADCELKVLPNPISRAGMVSFSLAAAQDVSLKLYDIAGRNMETIAKGRFTAGMHTIPLRTAGLPQGIYFLVLESPCLRKSVTVVTVR
jgi:hypothetical protein